MVPDNGMAELCGGSIIFVLPLLILWLAGGRLCPGDTCDHCLLLEDICSVLSIILGQQRRLSGSSWPYIDFPAVMDRELLRKFPWA